MSGILGALIAAYPTPASSSFESIATVTASGGETSLTFSSIPATFKHLQIRAIARDTSGSSGSTGCALRLNADGGSNYTWHRLYGNGSSATAAGSVSQSYLNIDASSLGGSSLANDFAASIIDLQEYANTAINKTVRMVAGADLNGSGTISLSSSVWLSTAAISSITVYAAQTGFAANSKFALYGIKGA